MYIYVCMYVCMYVRELENGDWCGSSDEVHTYIHTYIHIYIPRLEFFVAAKSGGSGCFGWMNKDSVRVSVNVS